MYPYFFWRSLYADYSTLTQKNDLNLNSGFFYNTESGIKIEFTFYA